MEKILLIALCFFVSAVLPADDKRSTRLLRLNKDHIVVTASSIERLESTLPANVTVITEADIKKSTAQTLPDIFKHLAGVDVREEFGDFSSSAVDIRGFGETAAANTLILVDGRKLNRADFTAVNFSTVPLNRIQQVEVYRGGRSVLYGNGATGGVINIITKKDREEGHSLTLQSEFGTQETYNFSSFLEGKTGNTSYTLDSSYHDTNGWRENNYERIKNAGFSVFLQEMENWDIFISGYATQTRIGAPSIRPAGGSRKDANSKVNYFEIEEKSLFVSPRYWINDDVNIEISASYREGESFYTAGSVTDYYSFSLKPKVQIDHDFGIFDNTTVFGIDYNHDKQIFGSERNRRSLGFYIFNTSSFFDDSLFLDLGYRRERYKMNIKGSSSELKPEDLDAATLGLTYKYSEDSKIFISLDKSFRYQRVDELGGATYSEALPPQSTYTYQGGISHTFNEHLKASLTYFHIDSQNEIFFDPTGFLFQNVSYEYTEREGVEFELLYQPLENLGLFFNYTKMNTELGGNDLTSNAAKGNHIPSVPEETLNAGFSWDFIPHFNLSMSGKWIDRYHVRGDYENTAEKDDGYIVVDSKLTFTWDWFSIYAGCNNLFDEAYNSNAAAFGTYPAPGRNFFGGVNMTFNF